MKLEVESSHRFGRIFLNRGKKFWIPFFAIVAVAFGFGTYALVRAITSPSDNTFIAVNSDKIYYGVNGSQTWSTSWYQVDNTDTLVGHDAMCMQASKQMPGGAGTAHTNTVAIKRIMLATVPSYSDSSTGSPHNYYNEFYSWFNNNYSNSYGTGWNGASYGITNLRNNDTGASNAGTASLSDAIFAMGHMLVSRAYANDTKALNSSDLDQLDDVLNEINYWFNTYYPNAEDSYVSFATWVDAETQTVGWLEYAGEPSAQVRIHKIDIANNTINATSAFRICELDGDTETNCQGPFQTTNGYTDYIAVDSTNIRIYETTVPYGYKCGDSNNDGYCDPVTRTVTLGGTYTFDIANIALNAVYVRIYKLDAEKLSPYARGTASIQNAVYGIYNSSNTRIATITINENGIGTSNIPISEGSGYYIKEDSASPSYTLNTSQRIYFNVTGSTQSPLDFASSQAQCTSTSTSACYFTDTVKKGKVSVTKQRSSYGASNSAYAGITFDIVNKNDSSETATMTTDSNGVATSPDLIYGQYTATERRGNNNQAYEMISFDFSITENGTTVDAGTKVNTVPDNPIISTVARNSNSSVGSPDKELEISGNAGITDNVQCSGLEAGKQYRFEGEIWYLDGNTRISSAGQTDFTADSSGHCGSVDVVFDPIDTSNYIGKKLAIKQYLYKYNGPNDWILVAIDNNNLSNTDEQITVKTIQIETTANSERTNNKELAAGKVKIQDHYQIIGMTNGQSYTLTGTVKDPDGNTVATTNHNITMTLATGATYTDTMEFEFDSTPYVGKNLSVVQTLKNSSDTTLATHEASDGSQTVSVLTPTLITNAVNGRDNSIKELEVGSTTIKDTVTYTGLVAGDTYTIKGEVWKLKSDGTKDTKVSTATRSFTASSENDTATGESLSFDIDTIANCAVNNKLTLPCKFVVFEYIYYGNHTDPFSRHEEVSDTKQIVSVKQPTLATVATDAQNNTKYLPVGTTTVIDEVSYDGLVPNQNYIIRGKLVETATGNVVKNSSGTEITGMESFPASGVSGKVTMDSFNTFDSTLSYDYLLGANQKKYTVYQTLYYGDVELASHNDLTDTNETVQIGVPKISTSATYKLDGTRMLGVGDVTMKDYVEYEGLVEGEWYMIEGTMIDPTTGQILEIDDEFVRNTKTFKADKDGKGEVALEINLNTITIQGKSYVVYEKLYRSYDKHGDGRVLVTHEDLTDEAQTVTVKVAKIETTATDKADGDNILEYEANQVIKDVVAYDGLLMDEEYTLYGYLFNKTTNQKLLDANGNEIFAVTTFTTPTKKDSGGIIMEFPVDASDLPGAEIVVFEYLYQGPSVDDGILVTKHEDPEDANQTVRVNMRVGTTAADDYDGDQIIGVGKVKVIDNLKYEGAVSGKTYKAIGRLVFQDTGEQVQTVTVTPLTIIDEGDDDDEPAVGINDESDEGEGEDETEPTPKTRTYTDIVVEKTFVVGSDASLGTSGTLPIEFEFDTRELIGKKLVVFEELYLIKDDGTEELVAEHKDLDDSAQTIEVATPTIHTIATDKLDDDKELANTGRVTVADKVEYKGLVAGTTYTLHGTLVDKESGEPLILEGITDVVWEFTPTRDSGTETLEFEIKTDGLAGVEIVAFEELYIDSEPEEQDKIAEHKDLNDGNQTVWVKTNVPETGLFTRTIDGARRTGALYAIIAIAVVSVSSLVIVRTYKRRSVRLRTKR